MNKSVFVVGALLTTVFGTTYFVTKANDNAGSSQPNSTQRETDDKGGKTVDLSGQQLTNIPDSVLGQTDITELNISNNQLTSLPGDITKLTNLEVLNIENNRLESLPSELSQLKKLREILANNNRIKNLPPELGVMTWLHSLDISGNDIPKNDLQVLKDKLPNTSIKE